MKIKKELLENLLEASKNTYPREFVALVDGNPLSDYILLPSVYGNSFAEIRMDLLPILEKPKASFHSHPSYSSNPSKKDLKFFSFFDINIISGYPYSFESTSFYDKKGKRIFLDLV